MSDSQSRPRPTVQPVLLVAIVALAGGALLLARSGQSARESEGAQAPGDPQTAVALLLQAQRDGDAQACRAQLAGEALQEFDARRQGLPSPQFAAELRSGLVDLKGYITTDINQHAPDAARLVLELIFADRNERQQLELRRMGGAWKVTRRTPSERLSPEVPWGTPVTPLVDDPDKR